MEALDLINLPTPKIEEWKYTNLPKALPVDLKVVDDEEIVVHIARGQDGGALEDIVFAGTDGMHHTPRLKVVLEEGASLSLVERHDGAGAYWKNMVTEITVGANARLHHVRVQRDSDQAVNTNMVHITMDRDAYYDGFTLNMGGKMTRHEVHIVMQGANAECHLNGVNMLNGKQHGDTTILIEHQAPHCQSNQFYRTLLDDQSRGVFQGKVHVHRPAQKTDGYQMSSALLLSPQAEMDTKPELEIYADDVLCSHGSTVGQMDESPLFYLRSRGLSEAEARMLLAQAFVNEVVDKVADEGVRGEVEALAMGWLAEALA